MTLREPMLEAGPQPGLAPRRGHGEFTAPAAAGPWRDHGCGGVTARAVARSPAPVGTDSHFSANNCFSFLAFSQGPPLLFHLFLILGAKVARRSAAAPALIEKKALCGGESEQLPRGLLPRAPLGARNESGAKV